MKMEKKSRNMVNCLLTTCLMSPAQVMKLKLSFIGQNGDQMVTLILCFTVHDIILWSIHVLNRFLQELDRRLLDTQKESKKHIPDRKQRIVGTPHDEMTMTYEAVMAAVYHVPASNYTLETYRKAQLENQQ